ncbi:hypothetical protein HY623_02535 [Candidatus Uhrbacteria bacterium]|nr:hypothetical protein [Candidatus Uhrbacteria bacterium]
MEKWNLKFNPTSVDAQHVPQEFLGEMMRLPSFEIQEVKKTEGEQKVVHDLNIAAERVFSALKLAPIHVPLERLHVVTPEAYRTLPAWRETSVALTRRDHIYVQRSENPESKKFIDGLSHEMAHVLSFSWENVMTTPFPKGDTGVYTSTKRSGFHFWDLEGKEYSGFLGVNEALTELFAGRLRFAYADIRKFSRKEKYFFQLTDTYTVPIVLLRTLFARFGGKQPRRMEDDYLRAYITGDISILRGLEKQCKGAVKALTEMSPSLDDCRKAARVLGIQDEYEESIKPLFEITHDDKKSE